MLSTREVHVTLVIKCSEAKDAPTNTRYTFTLGTEYTFYKWLPGKQQGYHLGPNFM